MLPTAYCEYIDSGNRKCYHDTDQHLPEVFIIDEMGTEEYVMAAASMAARSTRC